MPAALVTGAIAMSIVLAVLSWWTGVLRAVDQIELEQPPLRTVSMASLWRRRRRQAWGFANGVAEVMVVLPFVTGAALALTLSGFESRQTWWQAAGPHAFWALAFAMALPWIAAMVGHLLGQRSSAARVDDVLLRRQVDGPESGPGRPQGPANPRI